MPAYRTVKPEEIIAKFQQALDEGWGYILGKTHEQWTAEKQAAYRKAYQSNPEKYASRRTSAEEGGRWIGHWVTDCSGLFAWAFAELGSYMHHGATTMYQKYTTARGTFQKGKRTDGKALKAGTALFTGDDDTKQHVGLYIGNGYVIEAQGTIAGVILSLSSLTKWAYWGELKYVDYAEELPEAGRESAKQEERKDIMGKVKADSATVKMRKSPSAKENVWWSIPTGETYNVLGTVTENGKEWVKGIAIDTEGKSRTGYMMAEFVGMSGEASAYQAEDDNITLTISQEEAAEALQILDFLAARNAGIIASLTEKLEKTAGRG